jgi:hypothetical protein
MVMVVALVTNSNCGVALADKVVVLAVSVAIADMAAFSATVCCNTGKNNYTAMKLCFIVNESH